MREVKNVAIDLVEPNPYQPRLHFAEEDLMDLAQSIRENGLLQPISVRATKNGYQIVAGERRYRALRLNGATEVLVQVMEASDLQMAELALIENIQRSDLSAVEEAQSYVEIMNISHLTQSQLALKVGKSQSTIANKIRLLNLSEDVQEAVRSHKITERHARALLALDHDEQNRMLKTIEKKGLNVAQTEKMINKSKQPPKKEAVVRKAISKSMRIAINTIKQAVAMIQRTSTVVEMNEEERDDDVLITIRIPK